MTALSCGLLDGIIITILSNKRLTKVYNRDIILIEVVHLVLPRMLARLLWVHRKPSCWKMGWEPICTLHLQYKISDKTSIADALKGIKRTLTTS